MTFRQITFGRRRTQYFEIPFYRHLAFFSCFPAKLACFSKILKKLGARRVLALWALEWAWHSAEKNLRCAGSPRIYMPSPNILVRIVSKISAFIRTDGHGKIDSASD